MRKVDEQATKVAREKHEAGIERLNQLFAVTPLKLFLSGMDKHTGRPVPFRRKPGVPNMRPDSGLNARRRRRKAQRQARKRNRHDS